MHRYFEKYTTNPTFDQNALKNPEKDGPFVLIFIYFPSFW